MFDNLTLKPSSLTYGIAALGISVIGALAIGLAVIFGVNQQESTVNSANFTTVSYVATNGATFQVQAELATTAAQRERGLMFKLSLPAEQGMLFVFPNSQMLTFWMKDTYVSLDMIFLDEQGKVVTIHQNTSPNQTTTVYPSSAPAKYVLEVASGFVARSGLALGSFLLLNI